MSIQDQKTFLSNIHPFQVLTAEQMEICIKHMDIAYYPKDYLLGVNPTGIGALGALLHFIIAFVVSRMTPPPPEHIQELVERIRIPSGAGEALEH